MGKAAAWILLFVSAAGSGSVPTPPRSAAPTRPLRSIARLYMVFGQSDQAAVFSQRAVRLADTAPDDEAILCLTDRAMICSSRGELAEAVGYFNRAIRLQRQTVGNDHPSLAGTLRMLSDVYGRQQSFQQAERTLLEAVTIMLHAADGDDNAMSPWLLDLARLRFRQGRLDNADQGYQKALSYYRHSHGNRHLMTAHVQREWSEVCLARGDLERAERLLNESLATQRRIWGRYHPAMIDSWLSMARLCRLSGRVERSDYYLEKCKAGAAQTRNAVVLARVFADIEKLRNGGLDAGSAGGVLSRP